MRVSASADVNGANVPFHCRPRDRGIETAPDDPIGPVFRANNERASRNGASVPGARFPHHDRHISSMNAISIV